MLRILLAWQRVADDGAKFAVEHASDGDQVGRLDGLFGTHFHPLGVYARVNIDEIHCRYAPSPAHPLREKLENT